MIWDVKIQEFVDVLDIQRKSIQTINAYKETLNKFFNEYAQNIDENEITLKKIDGFIQYLNNNALERQENDVNGRGKGRTMINNRLKPSSINRHYAALRQFLIFIGLSDIAKQIRSIKIQPDFDTMEYSDIKKIFERKIVKEFYETKSIKKTENTEFYIDRMLLMIDFVFGIGTRAEETGRVKKSDLKVEGREVPIIELVGKGGKKRIVELSNHWLKEYKAFLKRYPQSADSEYLFTDVNGNKLSHNTLKTYIKELGLFAGLPHLSMHKLRHAYAMRNYEINNDIVELSKRMGHSSLNTTMIYLSKVINKDRALKSPFDEV